MRMIMRETEIKLQEFVMAICSDTESLLLLNDCFKKKEKSIQNLKTKRKQAIIRGKQRNAQDENCNYSVYNCC
jgi:hypothetical protein